MELIEQLLQDIWLEKTEAEIFLVCHKFWRLSTWSISRHVKLPRTTIYGYVEKLVEKKMLIPEKWTRGNYYRSISPDELIALFKNKKSHFDEIIEKVEAMKPALLELANQSKYVPKVQYYEWKETIALLYDKIYKAKERYFISDMDAIMDFMWWTPEQTAKAFIHPKWSSIELLLDTPRAREYLKYKHALSKGKKYNYSVKFLPSSNESIKSDTILIDGIYYHIAYWGNLFWIEINNDIFFQTQKLLFDKLWDSIK